MLPLYSSSINMRQPDSVLDAADIISTAESNTKTTLPNGRYVISEGTQTYMGKDVNIQTSDVLLAEKWESHND